MKLMKKSIFIILAIGVINMTAFAHTYWTINENPDTSDWFEWKNPDDLGMQGSVLDASFAVEAPAGKHGSIHAEGENLVFEDGTKVNFLGVNVSSTANFSSKEDARRLAARIGRLGFNLVRFHQLDFCYKNHIFGQGEVTSTLELDIAQLDKLFYFMNELKQRGIYFYVDLYTYRTAAKDDNIEDIDVGEIWNQQGHFDRELIKLQKNYIKQLLTTKNPYTGMTIAEDPAFVFTDIVNENGIYLIPANKFRGKYKVEFNNLFSNWLREKYGSDIALANAWSENGKIGLISGESIDGGNINILGNSELGFPEHMNSSGYSQKRQNDSWEFVCDVTKEYYTEMKEYIQNEIEAKCLVTGSCVSATTEYLAHLRINKETTDFVDSHQYMSHPDNGMKKGSEMWNDSSVRQSWLFVNMANNKVYGKPFVIGEFNECNNNNYHAEIPTMMTALATYQNWNPIQYAMIGKTLSENNGMLDSFSIYNDPVSNALWPAASLMMHRKEITPPNESKYVFADNDEAMTVAKKQEFNENYRFAKSGTMFIDLPDANASINSDNTYNIVPEISSQLGWCDYNGMYFSVDTDYTNAVTGFDKGKKFDFGETQITSYNDFANITVTSMNNRKLSESDKILIAAVARARNFEYKTEEISHPTSYNDWTGITAKVTNEGSVPVLAEGVNGKIVFKTSDKLTVFALDSNGKRIAEVPVAKTFDGWSEIELKKTYHALNYEVLRGELKPDYSVSVNEEGINIKGKAYFGKVSISILKPGAEDKLNIDNFKQSLYWIGEAETDNMGNFYKTIPFFEGAEYGNYQVLIGNMQTGVINLDAFRENTCPELSANIITVAESASVSGYYYTHHGKPIANKRVSLTVAKADSNSSEQSDIVVDNLFYLGQTVTNDEGKFDFSINLYGADGGTYKVFINAEPCEKATSIMVSSFTFTPPAYRVNIYNNENKESLLYNVSENEKITAVARIYRADKKGVLVLVYYDKNGKLSSVSAESEQINKDGELFVSFVLPKDFNGGYVSAYLLENMDSIKPITNKITLKAK